ncbi:hypothetical protein C7974DRAFT_65081 [Boeremia exigua]|uniref:uncharacterized protein n=1 Tax=Boeremia exigua TaxID=749465 RepID=UPI001E8DDCBB|nr:uncharacterized protein C7974DRAFT_65081 [Boeremia exigua]KAH6615384.1 hypothetical protein C7974DRAFT_65081 [Boeremia exigua]
MAEEDIRDTRASTPPSDQFLAAPVINVGRGRSSSAAPSFRSFQSHITTFEEKEDIQSVDSLHSNGIQVQRQQTFKIGRSVSLMDRVKGVFFPSTLMAKIENSIEVVKSDVPNDEMFHRQPSPWIVDVHVSRKANSRDHHKTLCLLDTGCLHGNIVSKELVETLGFTETDYQELSELERQGGVTMSGEPFLVEAAIFLSWHHNSSLKRFHRMRFLVASHGKNFDMIIGAQTICKYELMSRPVFGLDNGIVKSSGSGKHWNRYFTAPLRN